MTTNPHKPNLFVSNPGSTSEPGEETLRILAELPAPAGLEERVHAALHEARHRNPQRSLDGAGTDHHGRVLAWPTALKPQSSWMRTAAAAAIVFVVVGGGWGVYTRVGQNRPAKVLVMPRIAAPGGFSGAGAVRTPQTIPGPAAPQMAQPKAAKKPSPRPGVKAPAGSASQTGLTSQPAGQK